MTAKSNFLYANGGSFTETTTRGTSPFNLRRFRQPIRSCGIVLTANQRYDQNLAATCTNVREFVSGPILERMYRYDSYIHFGINLLPGSNMIQNNSKVWKRCVQIQTLTSLCKNSTSYLHVIFLSSLFQVL